MNINPSEYIVVATHMKDRTMLVSNDNETTARLYNPKNKTLSPPMNFEQMVERGFWQRHTGPPLTLEDVWIPETRITP